MIQITFDLINDEYTDITTERDKIDWPKLIKDIMENKNLIFGSVIIIMHNVVNVHIQENGIDVDWMSFIPKEGV